MPGWIDNIPGNFGPYDDPFAGDSIATDNYLKSAVVKASLPDSRIHSRWEVTPQRTMRLFLTIEIPEIDELYNFLESKGYTPKDENSIIGAVKALRKDFEDLKVYNKNGEELLDQAEKRLSERTEHDRRLIAMLVERVYSIDQEVDLLMDLNDAAQKWTDHIEDERRMKIIEEYKAHKAEEDANNHD